MTAQVVRTNYIIMLPEAPGRLWTDVVAWIASVITLMPEAARRESHCFVMLRMATLDHCPWISKQLKASNPKGTVLELIERNWFQPVPYHCAMSAAPADELARRKRPGRKYTSRACETCRQRRAKVRRKRPHNPLKSVLILERIVWWQSTVLLSLHWPWRSMRVLYSRGRATASAQVLCNHAAQTYWAIGACAAHPRNWPWRRHPANDEKWRG